MQKAIKITQKIKQIKGKRRKTNDSITNYPMNLKRLKKGELIINIRL